MTAALLIATALLLIAVAIWDCRRTFKRVDEARPRHVEPIDFAGEIRVRDRTRRGPEPVDHPSGKQRVGL